MKNFLTSPLSNAVGLGVALVLAVMLAVSSAAPADIAPLALSGGATNFSIVQTGDGTVGAPAHSFTSDTDNGLYLVGTNNVGLSAGGVKVLDATASGVSIVGSFAAPSGVSSAYVTATTALQAQALVVTSTARAAYITATTAIQAQAATITGAVSAATVSAYAVTATASVSTPLLYVEGVAQSGPVSFGSASNVVSGTLIAHGLGTTPTSFIAQNAVIQAAIFTQTLYSYGCNTVSCTVGVSEGAVATFTTVNWMAGR